MKMSRPFLSVPAKSLFSLLFISAPSFISGNTLRGPEAHPRSVPVTSHALPVKNLSREEFLREEAHEMYDAIRLKKSGLNPEAFELAWIGYSQLVEKGMLEKTDVISICDFSQSSKRKRFYVIDLQKREVLVQTWVAHGRNSGGEFARSFSNRPESHKSSLGFFITGNTYYGDHGLSLRLEGLEKGINDRADERKIVIHGSSYVGWGHLRNNCFTGRSYGCPAVPMKESKTIIHTIKDGSCLFIYHPAKNYLAKSTFLNG